MSFVAGWRGKKKYLCDFVANRLLKGQCNERDIEGAREKGVVRGFHRFGGWCARAEKRPKLKCFHCASVLEEYFALLHRGLIRFAQRFLIVFELFLKLSKIQLGIA